MPSKAEIEVAVVVAVPLSLISKAWAEFIRDLPEIKVRMAQLDPELMKLAQKERADGK